MFPASDGAGNGDLWQLGRCDRCDCDYLRGASTGKYQHLCCFHAKDGLFSRARARLETRDRNSSSRWSLRKRNDVAYPPFSDNRVAYSIRELANSDQSILLVVV